MLLRGQNQKILLNRHEKRDMSKRIDLAGKRFGRLLVIRYNHTDKGNAFWYVRCDCGNIKTIIGKLLKNGESKSCGCLRVELATNASTKHGMANSPENVSWQNMLQRCHNPKNNSFGDYGGRGIRVCERWKSFENFFADMGKRPAGMTLERKDNGGDYEPGNCCWGSRKVQNNNKRNNVIIIHNGKSRNIAQWAKETGIAYATMLYRYRRGLSKSLIFKKRRLKTNECRQKSGMQ